MKTRFFFLSVITSLIPISLWAQSQTGGSFVGTNSSLHSANSATDQTQGSSSQSGSSSAVSADETSTQKRTGSYSDVSTTGSGVSLYPNENPSVDALPSQEQNRP